MEKIFFVLAFGSFLIALALIIFTMFLKDLDKVIDIQLVAFLFSIFSVMGALVLLTIN